MAFTATTNWEVETTGSDNNGGGFDSAASGTDYSYGVGQTTIAYTDIVIGGTTTQGTSVIRPFIAADVGNVLNIVSGTNFTVQRVQIASVTTGTATFDKSLGTAGGSGGTGTLGGALATPGQAAAVQATGNSVYIKAGTYAMGTGTANTAGNRVVTTIAGTGSNQVIWQGYQTTRGDSGTAPLLQNSGNTANAVFDTSGVTGITVENISVDGASGATMTGFSGGVSVMHRRCKAINCPTAGFQASASASIYELCESASNGIGFNGRAFLYYCNAHGNSSNGFVISSGTANVSHCLAYGNTGAGFINTGIQCTYGDCTSYNNGTFGFSITGSSILTITTMNCLAFNNTTKDFNWSTGTKNYMFNCAYGTVAGAGINESPIVLTANPFNNAAGNDFTLNNVSGGGNLARSSTKLIFMGSSTTTYKDVGAAQHQDNPPFNLSE